MYLGWTRALLTLGALSGGILCLPSGLEPDDEHRNDGGSPTQGATTAANVAFNIGPPEGISPSFSLSQPL